MGGLHGSCYAHPSPRSCPSVTPRPSDVGAPGRDQLQRDDSRVRAEAAEAVAPGFRLLGGSKIWELGLVPPENLRMCFLPGSGRLYVVPGGCPGVL